MAGELPSGRTVEMSFHPMTNGGQEGTKITLHTVPPTNIFIAPGSVRVESGGFAARVQGQSTYTMGADGLVIDTLHQDGTSRSRMLVTRTGRLVMDYNPVLPKPQRVDTPSTKPELPARLTRKEEETLFATLDIRHPETFAAVPYNLVVKYFRTKKKMTQTEMADQMGVSLSKIIRIETGATRISRPGMHLEIRQAFGFDEVDSRLGILDEAYERERAALAAEKEAGQTGGEVSDLI